MGGPPILIVHFLSLSMTSIARFLFRPRPLLFPFYPAWHSLDRNIQFISLPSLCAFWVRFYSRPVCKASVGSTSHFRIAHPPQPQRKPNGCFAYANDMNLSRESIEDDSLRGGGQEDSKSYD